MLPATGLSERSAQDRLERDGPNELPTAKPRRILVLSLGSYSRADGFFIDRLRCDLSRTG